MAVRRRPRRLAIQLLTMAVLGSVLALGPQPSFATEHAMDLDTVPVELQPVAVPSPRGAESAATRLVGGDDDVAEFTMIGASYDAARPDQGRVRVLVDGAWTQWFKLLNAGDDTEHAPDAGTAEAAGARPASDPVWVGEGEGYQVSLPADAGDVEVHLVRETEETVVVDGTEEAEGAGGAPAVRSRGSWGAAPYRGRVDTFRNLRQTVVHHTVNGNGYSAAQVPSMLRSIQRYHQDGRGWDDIGYNMIVDRFGTIWEGRAQSHQKLVIGAHAVNHNTGSVGIAYLGDGRSASLSANAVNRLGTYIGWKMHRHGRAPTHGNIVGHRQVGSTECPGGRIFGQMGAIRTRAINVDPPAPPEPYHDVGQHSAVRAAVEWADARNIISPYADNSFRPGNRITRADAINWLWRFSGRPAASGPGYSDVPAGAYYRQASQWGKAEGITLQQGATFGPANHLSRHQYVAQLWRWAGQPEVTTKGYDDAKPTKSLRWARSIALVPGRNFGPANAKIERGEAIRLIYRLRDQPPGWDT